jgi:hypothetical protein
MNVTAELSIIRGRLASLETRLTDVRGGAGPGGVAAHHLTHEPGGADELTLVTAASDADTVDGQHAAEFLGAGAQAVDSDMVDGSHAAAFQPAGVVPAHHGSHEGAGGGAGADKIKLDDLDTPDDNADLDVTTGHHGLVPKRDGSASKFFSADGTYKTVTAGASNSVKLWTPDAFPAGAAAQCDHFDDASIDAKWLNFHTGGNQTITEADHHLKFVQAGDNGAFYCRGKYQLLPAGDFTIIAKIGGTFSFVNYFELGIMFTQDATNNPNTCDIFTLGYQFEIGASSVRYQQWNDWQALVTNAGIFALSPPPAYLRVRRSGTTLYWDMSHNGHLWVAPWASSGQIFVPDGFGLYTSNYSAVSYTAWFDFIFYKASFDALPQGVVEEFWIT